MADMTYAGRLRRTRSALDLSQRELSRRAGLTETHVGLIERRINKSPRWETSMALAKALGVNTEWLHSGKGKKCSIS